MSSIRTKKIEKILNALCVYENVQNINQLAPKLGYEPGAVYKWIERGSIPVNNLSKKRPDLNRQFLLGNDAQIRDPNYDIEQNLESKEGIELLKRIQKEFVSNNSEGVSNHSRKILLAFRDQLKSQKSETDSMIQLLDLVLNDSG